MRQDAGPMRRSSSLEPKHLPAAAALLLLVLVVHSRFDAISRVLLITYAAAIVAVALNVLVSLVPTHRRIMAAILGVAIFGGIGGGLWVGIPALAGQFRGLVSQAPNLQAQLERLSASLREATGLNIELFGERSRRVVASLFNETQVLGTAAGVAEALFLPILILIGALYAVAKPNDRLLTPLLQAVPAARRSDFRRFLTLLARRLRGWVKGTFLSMCAVGILTTVGLMALGVPYSLLLGVISAMLEIVPFLGPIVGGSLAVSAAFLDSPSTAIWVVILMVAIQQVESNLITPLVMAHAAHIHPFLTLFSLFLFGSLFGLLGVILAVPLVLLVWTIGEVFWTERSISLSIDDSEPLVHE